MSRPTVTCLRALAIAAYAAMAWWLGPPSVLDLWAMTVVGMFLFAFVLAGDWIAHGSAVDR